MSDLYQPECNAIEAMLHEQRQLILDHDNTVTGFNIGINAGASAGQTVFHVHVHLIPRRDGDVVDPRGGVRGVILTKQGYCDEYKSNFSLRRCNGYLCRRFTVLCDAT